MVTLTFCPGLRFCTPIFVPVCDGFGTIVTGFFVGFGVGFFVVVAFGVGVGALGASVERSLIVTFTFWPGKRLSICTFAREPAGFGAMFKVFLFAAGELLGRGAGVGVTAGLGVCVAVTEGLGVAVTEGLGAGVADGFGAGVADGFGVGVVEGVGVTDGLGVGVADGVGVGVADGLGVGVAEGVGVGVGLGVTGAGAGATGAGVTGAGVTGVGAGVGAGVGSLNVTATGAEVALAKRLSPSLVALTIQVPAPVDVTSPSTLTKHPAAVPPVMAYEIFPTPLPPPTVTVTVSPISADPPLKVRVAWDDSATPIVTFVVAVFVSEPIWTDAVIVNVAEAVTVSGVPDIVPVVVSKARPAGSVPLISKTLDVPGSESTVTSIGVIAVPTASVVVVIDAVSPGLVVKVEVVIDGPAPAALLATTSATYCVPGRSPVTLAKVVKELTVTDVPDPTGETVTV